MRKFAPHLLVVAFSDVEAAHFGSYALHTSGIKTADRLTYQLWQEIEANPDYREQTTMSSYPNSDAIPTDHRPTDSSIIAPIQNQRETPG